MRNMKLVVTVLGWALVVAAGSTQAGDLYELDTGRELAIGGATLLVGGATWWQAQSVAPPDSAELAALDAADLPALDRFATELWSPRAAHWSDVSMITLGLSPLALLLETGDGMSSGELLAMYGEMIAMEQIAISALKVGVGRLRPLAYNDDPRIPDDIRFSRYARRSFPSGHTATAFAGAMFTSEVYARLNPQDDARHWVRGSLLTVAALTGYLRVRSGNHFPTDILAGAVVGGVIGWAVPALHERDPDPLDPDTGRRAPGPTLAIGFGF